MEIHKFFAIALLWLTCFFVYADDSYSAAEYMPKSKYSYKIQYPNIDANQASATIATENLNVSEPETEKESLAIIEDSIDGKLSSDSILETKQNKQAVTFQNKEKTKIKKNAGNNKNIIIITLTVIFIISVFIFRKPSTKYELLRKSQNMYSKVDETITGVERYIEKQNSNKTGVTKYLERHQKPAQLTGVSKYIAKQIVNDKSQD